MIGRKFIVERLYKYRLLSSSMNEKYSRIFDEKENFETMYRIIFRNRRIYKLLSIRGI